MLVLVMRLLIAGGLVGLSFAVKAEGRKRARSSGWSKLVDRFPDQEAEVLLVIKRAPARLNDRGRYGGMEMHACSEGLRIYGSEAFAPMTTPIFLAWGDIAARPVAGKGDAMVRLGLGAPEAGVLTVDRAMWDRLTEARDDAKLASSE